MLVAWLVEHFGILRKRAACSASLSATVEGSDDIATAVHGKLCVQHAYRAGSRPKARHSKQTLASRARYRVGQRGSTSCPRAASRAVARKACGRCRPVGYEALVAADRRPAPSRPSPSLIRARVCELNQKGGEARAAQRFARTPLCELMDDGWDVRARVVADAPVCVHRRHAFFMSKCV